MPGKFWRDASGRLTFDAPEVAAADYPLVCRTIADALGLSRIGDFAIGPDQMFCDFRRAGAVVGLDWDIWMGLMVVAKSRSSEPMVEEIAAWIGSNQWSARSVPNRPSEPGA